MNETREQFHSELSDLEELIQDEARTIRVSLARVVDMLQTGSGEVAEEIIAGDDAIDLLYVQVERDVASILSRQAPVAVDLRLVLAVVHINHNLERIGDQCVNIAKLFQLTMRHADSREPDPRLHGHVQPRGRDACAGDGLVRES